MIKVLFTGLMALSALSVAADTKTVTSPDGKVAVSVSAENGQAFYTVDYDGKPMLTRSALGLNTSYGDFTKELTLANASEKNVDVNYELSRSKVAKVAHKAKELTVAFTNAKTDTMKVVFHVSDNAVAYRYTLVRPKRNNPKTAIIYSEASAFNFLPWCALSATIPRPPSSTARRVPSISRSTPLPSSPPRACPWWALSAPSPLTRRNTIPTSP